MIAVRAGFTVMVCESALTVGEAGQGSDGLAVGVARLRGVRAGAVLGKQRQCPRTAGVLVEYLDGLASGCGMGRADLAQTQNVALHHAAAFDTLVLDDASVTVRLAILLSPGLPQKHDPANLARRIRRWESGRSSLPPFLAVAARYNREIPTCLSNFVQTKIGFFGVESAKSR